MLPCSFSLSCFVEMRSDFPSRHRQAVSADGNATNISLFGEKTSAKRRGDAPDVNFSQKERKKIAKNVLTVYSNVI